MAGYSTTDPKTGQPARKALYDREEQEARARLSKALAAQGRGQLTFVRAECQRSRSTPRGWLSASSVRLKTGLGYRELLGKHVVPALSPIQQSRLEPQHPQGRFSNTRLVSAG